MMDERTNTDEIRGPICPAVSINPRYVKVVKMPKGWRWMIVTVQIEGNR